MRIENNTKMAMELNSNTASKNNRLLKRNKQNEILVKFRLKLGKIESEIHKLISELYIPETKLKQIKSLKN